MKNNFKKWLYCALIRAIRTMAQTAVSTIGVSTFLEDVSWYAVLSISALAGILSIITSIAGLPELKEEEIKYEHI